MTGRRSAARPASTSSDGWRRFYALRRRSPGHRLPDPGATRPPTTPAAAAARWSPRTATTSRSAWCWSRTCSSGSRRHDPRVRLDDDEPRRLLHGHRGGQPLPLPPLLRAQSPRAVTQLELELQGEVDKYLYAVFLLSLQNEGAVSARLRELLFQRYRLDERLSRRAGRALPRGQRPGLPVLRLARRRASCGARRLAELRARGAPLLPPRPAGEAGDDRPGSTESGARFVRLHKVWQSLTFH